jgi:hypothetical protein
MPSLPSVEFKWVQSKGLSSLQERGFVMTILLGFRMTGRCVPPPGYFWNCKTRLSRARVGLEMWVVFAVGRKRHLFRGLSRDGIQ